MFVGVVDETSDIYLWQSGSGNGSIKALTITPEKEGNACWWPQKKLILASRETEPGRYGLVAIDSRLETIWTCEDPIGSLGWPVPSPWDNRILCVRECGDGTVQPGMVTMPEGNFEPFEFNGLSGGQLAWLAPDMVQLSRVTQAGFVITHRDLQTREEKIIVSGGNNWQSHINVATGNNLFVRRAGQIGSIFRLLRTDEQKWEYENLTNARTYDWQPSLSTDGAQLIFRSLRNGFFVTVVRSMADSSPEKELILPIEGFSQIYFPVIVDSEFVLEFTR
ncbi:MAG: hypothetical protein ACOYXC_14390 [Candidatus Rifleibacteriota bacterium]